MEQEDCDVITTLQTDVLAQLFGSEELESRTTPFQERVAPAIELYLRVIHKNSEKKEMNHVRNYLLLTS